MSTNLRGSDLEGRTVYTSDGEKLGKVDSVLVDRDGSSQYIEVRSGWFGTRRHTVPLSGVGVDGDDLRLAYTKEQLESAPTFDDDEYVDYDRERALAGHYGHDVRDWDDDRDAWLAGEDLSRGPTPETRHPGGGRDDVRDTTQGPTPETRRAMRAGDDDPSASGQPAADERTRADVGGHQDAGDLAGTTGRDTPGRASEAMARREEPATGTRRAESDRVRLRPWTRSGESGTGRTEGVAGDDRPRR